MKKVITVLKREGCAYSSQVRDVVDRLRREYPKVEIEIIDSQSQPELAAKFASDYSQVPCIFVGNEKVYESYKGEAYEECYEKVEKAFQLAAK